MSDDVTMAVDSARAATAPGSPTTDPNVKVIRAKRGWQAVDLAEMWRYRELLYFLVWRDIKAKHKQTVLGGSWAVLQPVISMVVFTVVFGNGLGVKSDPYPYPIFVYAGLLPWNFFAGGVSGSGDSLVGQANLLTKIYFPRLFVPLSTIGSRMVNFSLSFVIYFALMAWYWDQMPTHPGLMLLLIPLLILLTIMTALGVGCVLSSLTVSYRDFRIIVPFLVQIWMFLSPVIYPVTTMPEKYQSLMALNPMTGIIEGFRSALLNQPANWEALMISSGMAVGIFLFGLFYFRRTERRFADIV